MSCDVWRDALSALADDEPPGIDLRLLAAHVQRCASCQRFAAAVEAGRSAVGVRSVASLNPSFPEAIARQQAAADRFSVPQVARWGLAVVAVYVMAFSAVALAGGGSVDSIHASRHLGAFTAAYSVGLAVVVFRPARARTMLPVSFVLVGALAITAVIDLVEGHIPLLAEASHLPELFSVFLLWVIANAPLRADQQAAAALATAATRPALRIVDDETG